MSDTTGWTRIAPGAYQKRIDGLSYYIFAVKDASGTRTGYWFVRRGHIHGKGYVGEWERLSEAQRAAHRHAEETK